MTLNKDIAGHYRSASLIGAIDAALAVAGVDPAAPTPEDLKPVDEFHTGGLLSTEALLDQVRTGQGTRAVDLGCGIGGTARYLALTRGLEVTGIDLTEDYVTAGQELNRRLGLDDRITLQVGSVLRTGLPDASADLVTQFHVGMNIEDKAALFEEVARILAPGGTYALFDLMAGTGGGEMVFPLPWSTVPATSFVTPAGVYHSAGRAAGLDLVSEQDRHDFALRYFDRVLATLDETGLPPVGIHLLMGANAEAKLRNFVTNLRAERVTPVEMVWEKPA